MGKEAGMESEPEGLQDGAIAEELEARLRALAAEVEAADLPPHLEALADRKSVV